MDVLSEVLREVRLTGALYFDVSAGAPWVATTPGSANICGAVMPGFEHVMAFHILLEGHAWVQLAGEPQPSVHLQVGDGVIIARGDAHSLSSEPGKHGAAQIEMYRRPVGTSLPYVLREFGGTGEKTRFACAFFGCEVRPYNPVFEAMPRLFSFRGDSAAGAATLALIRTALGESQSPRAGGEAIIARTSELMFLHAVRQYIDDLAPESRGWLAALRDPQIGTALRLMHSRPSEPWTLDALAREAGLSRTTLSERFGAVVGMTAMQYLSNWRLQIAAGLLSTQRTSIGRIATEVGYDSQASFNRAFKRQVGMPPGAWRRKKLAQNTD